MNCDICGAEILDYGETPVFIDAVGWTLDEDNEPYRQYTIHVCRDCLDDRGDEILKKLEDYKDQYE